MYSLRHPYEKKPKDRDTSKVIVLKSSKKKDFGKSPSKSLKRKEKQKVDLAHDSDCENEVPILKRYRLNQELNSENVICKVIPFYIFV